VKIDLSVVLLLLTAPAPALLWSGFEGDNFTRGMGFTKWRSKQPLSISFRKGAHPAGGIRHNMSGFSFRDYLAVGCPYYFVAEPQRTSAQFGNVGSNYQLIVVISRRLVTAVGFGDNQKGIVTFFHIAVREPAGTAIVCPADFEPDKIVGIIDNAHLVRLGVAHAQHRFVPNTGYIRRSRACHLNECLRTL
jgi:hypothetical protein